MIPHFDRGRVATTMRRRCAEGKRSACKELKRLLKTGVKLPWNSVQLRRWYYQKCNGAKGKAACLKYIQLFAKDMRATSTKEGRRIAGRAARRALEDVCERKHTQSCYTLGLMMVRGIWGPIQRNEGRGWVEKACGMGLKQACLDAAKQYEDGTGEVNRAHAKKLRAKATKLRPHPNPHRQHRDLVKLSGK